MVILITGATHTGKTRLAQKLMEQRHIPYLSQDHLKMGLIRSGYTSLTPEDTDETLTEYLWPVTREIVKTAIENRQNLIIEGCYIPFTWRSDFSEEYLRELRFLCLCFSDGYIDTHYADILRYEACIEDRQDDGYCTLELLKKENRRFREGCAAEKLPCVLIEDDYARSVGEIAL